VTRQFLTALFIGSVLAMGCGPARAHSFNLGFVTTLTGPHASRGKQALDGFLLATGERDAHPGEESDGHLGGLDVYVFRIDSNLGAEAVRRRLRELLRGQRLMFVTGVYEPGVMEAVDEAVRGTEALFVDPTDSAMFRASGGDSKKLSTMTQKEFSASFRHKYGYEPGASAARGYIAARLIAATVRALEGSPLERDALQTALDQVRMALP
jgi:ABC-type branched-subunit amino acid transport system substrate-binding protein